MKNPFNQPDFQITDDYVRRCIEAAAVPHTVYSAYTGREFPGELFVLLAEKTKFSDEQQAMISFMQSMLLLIFGDDNLSSYDEEAITNLTNSECLVRWYNELEYENVPVDYFRKEADWLFRVFTEHFNGSEDKQYWSEDNEPYGFFKDHQPVDSFEKINPLEDEVVLRSFSLVNYNDGKYFFAISEKNYILLNWQSGGPMHLLAKPEKRIPGSILLSSDAFYGALGIKKEEE